MTSTRWQRRTLGDIAELVGGGTPSRTRKEFFGSDIDWVTPTDLPAIGEVHTLGSVKEGLTREGLANSSAKELPPGAVLFSSRASIGKIAVANRPCCTNQGFTNFVPHTDITDSWFLAYYLAAKTPDILALAGETTFKEVSRSKLRSFPIQFPDLAEQRRIVARIKECMERIDEVRELRSKAVREAGVLMDAIRYDAWEQLATHYGLVPLSEYAESTRNGLYKPRKYHGTGTLLLRMFNIYAGSLHLGRLERLEVTDTELEQYGVYPGDILISRVNSHEIVGKSAHVAHLEEPALFEAMLIRLRVKSDMEPYVISQLMNAPQFLHHLRGRAKHAIGQSSINQDDLLETELPNVPLGEQARLAESLYQELRAAAQLTDTMATTPEHEHLVSAVLHKAFVGDL